MRFSNSVSIRRPVHDVFEYVADLEHAPSWNYALVETRKTSDGPIGVGTTYVQLRSIPAPSQETLRVSRFEPDRLFEVDGDLGPFSGRLTYEFASDDGATLLTNTVDLEPSGLARLAAPLAAGRIRESVAANLAVLKDLLERST